MSADRATGKNQGRTAQLEDVAFDSRGLVPVVVQEVRTHEVLMLAYANREALECTFSTGYAHFYSRSRQELWKKGATSGNLQRVTEVWIDCDGDTLLYLVEACGPACHTGERTCFFRQIESAALSTPSKTDVSAAVLEELFGVLEERKQKLPAGSYVTELLQGNWDAVPRKVGEEATEVILAAVQPGQPELVAEVADLWFHSLVLLAQHNLTLADLLEELRSRRRSGVSGGK